MGKKIVMLVGQGVSSNYVYNGLKADFEILKVIMEAPVPRQQFLKRRIKNLGWWTVFGQLLFQAGYVPFLTQFSKTKIKKILAETGLSDQPIPEDKVLAVPSINAPASLALLQQLQPDILIVQGTRIISKKILNSVTGDFINTHAGITPKYRGVHGGYWAMANKDSKHCGVTVHLVDPGIDTGGILYQDTINVSPQDNFTTYTYKQSALGIQLMKKAIAAALKNKLTTFKGPKESKLYYHPTLWQYLYLRIFKGVK